MSSSTSQFTDEVEADRAPMPALPPPPSPLRGRGKRPELGACVVYGFGKGDVAREDEEFPRLAGLLRERAVGTRR
jgi:hypothetical protein